MKYLFVVFYLFFLIYPAEAVTTKMFKVLDTCARYRLGEINANEAIEKLKLKKEKNFQISVRHSFPIERRELKHIGTCQNCGEKFFYRKRIKNIACKKCCVNFFNGSWNQKCLILFD